MARRWIIGLCFLPFFLDAQVERTGLGIGTVGGFNSAYADGGVVLQAVFFSHFDVNAGIATRRYQGAGFSFGWRYYPMGVKKFRPVVGVNLMQINGRTFSIDHNGFFSLYSTPKNQYINSSAGIVYPMEQLDLLLLGGYTLAKSSIHTVNESGFADETLMKNIDSRINGGWGITFGLIFRPWRERNTSDPEFNRM